MESPTRPINKKKNNIYKNMRATCGSNKELLEKMPIYRATENLIALQILQPVGVILTCLRDFEGPDPQGFKFFVLASVLSGRIPFKHQISQLEILFSRLSVKGLLDSLLMLVSSGLTCSLVYWTSTSCRILLIISSGSSWQSWKNFSTGRAR
jgi:hypothetical protein